MELKCISLVLLIVLIGFVEADLCPKQCDCDMFSGLNRALCTDQNIISIEVGVPNSVQIYSLSHNSISELDNFCFKEAGYTELQVLDLSSNLIFWIGLHAFSELKNLVHLDLSSNRLRYITSDLFWDTPNLLSVDLSSNIFESLKNEPLIIHSKLEVLNLNNCRIKALPDRLFSRLPNLQKLDISENYMIALSTKVLLPLRKLNRIELRNDYWHCNAAFKVVESWIVARGIKYQKQCKEKAPKMSEKMISIADTDEKKEVDVNTVWNVTTPKTDIIPETKHKDLSAYEKFDRDFSSVQAFVIGMQLGLAIGIVGTYIWLRKFCKCGQLDCTRPQTRRQRRRAQRVREGDMRANLLWSNVATADTETPPSQRRLPDGSSAFPTYGIPVVTEPRFHADIIRPPDRPETPPPPYTECHINI